MDHPLLLALVQRQSLVLRVRLRQVMVQLQLEVQEIKTLFKKNNQKSTHMNTCWWKWKVTGVHVPGVQQQYNHEYINKLIIK